MTTILGIKLNNRNKNSSLFQNIISKYGCDIGTRIGLPPKNAGCELWGIILLELINKEHLSEIEKELLKIDNIEIQRMEFN